MDATYLIDHCATFIFLSCYYDILRCIVSFLGKGGLAFLKMSNKNKKLYEYCIQKREPLLNKHCGRIVAQTIHAFTKQTHQPFSPSHFLFPFLEFPLFIYFYSLLPQPKLQPLPISFSLHPTQMPHVWQYNICSN